ncbi:class C sortase [Macrococcus sp. EM39E]|uniref:class C sortase n=1 Tax=Macrococcus animalis TaxID=3395467 RepID=UPI0039BE200F
MKQVINLMFICGLLIALYPIITKVYYNYDSTRQSELLDNKDLNDTMMSKYKQQKAYNEATRSAAQNIIAPSVKSKPKDKDTILEKSEEVIATIKIPKLKLHYPVFDGATPENLNKGVSRVLGTSYPTGGLSTNSVFAAHSYSPFQEWFTHIDQLQYGDLIIVNNFKEKLYYRVTDFIIVSPDKVSAMNIIPGKDMITLLTCTPNGKERLLVYTTRVKKQENNKVSNNNSRSIRYQKSWLEDIKVISSSWFTLLLIFILTYIFLNIKRK